jgi:hypothetical protein
MSVRPTSAEPAWQAVFLALLPALEMQARQLVRRCPCRDREEASQAVLAYAALECARLAERNRLHLAFPSPLARFGWKQYYAGRSVGGSVNSRDVASLIGQRQRGCLMEPFDEWQEATVETRRTTPAEIAALRVDFGDWLQTLSPRDRMLTNELARGESTNAVATMFRLTAGRVSQLRREFEKSWRRFVGEPYVPAC